MTAGNGVRATTPGLPSLNTGGEDPTVGKGNPAINVPDNPPGGVVAAGILNESRHSHDEALYGVDRDGNMSMQDMGGTLTMSGANADAAGSMSMQDMSGPQLSQTPKTSGGWGRSITPMPSNTGNDMDADD